jgi:hypothetical protein
MGKQYNLDLVSEEKVLSRCFLLVCRNRHVKSKRISKLSSGPKLCPTVMVGETKPKNGKILISPNSHFDIVSGQE